MKKSTSTSTFNVSLGSAEHNLAQKYSQQQNSDSKAKQVYLNMLAVCAVDFYLNCLSIKTDLPASDCCNPLLLAFMDVADILLPESGQLECRPIMPDAENLEIPPDVHTDRIGYFAVRLSHSLQQAEIVGFTSTAFSQIPLTELRSLEEFPLYLERLQQQSKSHPESPTAATPSITKLTNWLKGTVEAGWQTAETLIQINSLQPLALRDMEQLETKVKRAKAIDLGMKLGNDEVVLALMLTTQPDETINILVQVYPPSGTSYLPTDLKLEMLSDSGKILQETVASSLNNYVQLRRFSGQQGDRFSITITLNRVTVKEDFVL